ncbi:hypothetical protein CK203_069542 [Vitis vinifera]|uniref:Uncharacterized protein n=1 Tax=Vitis vinifera TaxID=29760 RepID=A0A438EKW8_VITVI|nr:hypothetical protein CK203_069542 [Vitis vinifera]
MGRVENLEELSLDFGCKVILGLRINLEKSKLISTGRVENFEELSLKFGCKVDELPFSYLGLLYAFLSSLWQCRMEWRRGFSKRLAMWKRHISKGGRLTLIQSTLSNMSIYSMSSFYILRTIMLRLEQIQRDFLWGGEALEWKPHLVRRLEWQIFATCQMKGVLGPYASLALQLVGGGNCEVFPYKTTKDKGM